MIRCGPSLDDFLDDVIDTADNGSRYHAKRSVYTAKQIANDLVSVAGATKVTPWIEYRVPDSREKPRRADIYLAIDAQSEKEEAKVATDAHDLYGGVPSQPVPLSKQSFQAQPKRIADRVDTFDPDKPQHSYHITMSSLGPPRTQRSNRTFTLGPEHILSEEEL